MTTQRAPTYRSVERELDLEDLIPGDRVRVQIAEKIIPMTYEKMVHGNGQERLNSKSEIYFIEIPGDYNKEDKSVLNVWTSLVKTMQFPDRHIYLDRLHRNIERIDQDHTRYNSVKSLIDLLEN